MVLVDTSVWIRFLTNQNPYAAHLATLLGAGQVGAHAFVLGELLIGDKGGRARLLADYELMHAAPTVSNAEVMDFVQDRRLHGRGIGWIDAHLLASALVGQMTLWTADAALRAIATELRIHFD